MRVLSIETSCDETGVALYDGAAGRLLAHAVHSQVPVHAEFGGVVPELASRDHVARPCRWWPRCCAGPGSTARPSMRWPTPAAPADRRPAGRPRPSGAAWPGPWACRRSPCTTWRATCWPPCSSPSPPNFPSWPCSCRAATPSWSTSRASDGTGMLASRLDDAAGEAFDKTAKLLGLPYPGGPSWPGWPSAATRSGSAFPGR